MRINLICVCCWNKLRIRSWSRYWLIFPTPFLHIFLYKRKEESIAETSRRKNYIQTLKSNTIMRSSIYIISMKIIHGRNSWEHFLKTIFSFLHLFTENALISYYLVKQWEFIFIIVSKHQLFYFGSHRLIKFRFE